jgi:myo-inositol 2-dehydrogenase/D-chiro-inositol 1-dehydrogenase
MTAPLLGVGLLGAGPVTQAIHLPTLAALGDSFRVVHIMDVVGGVAAQVAEALGARWSTSVEELLADPAVEVVAICSPPEFHADQIIAACRAGKKAVLCEKPFVLTAEEAELVAAVSHETGVPILVGAMHSYDPVWLAAREAWNESGGRVHTIRSSIALPPNARFEDLATEMVGRLPRPEQSEHEVRQVQDAELLRGAVLGLAIHDLPLVRSFVVDGDELRVCSASFEPSYGYLIVLRIGGLAVELHAAITENWAPDWVLEVIADDIALTLTFPPSYVQAGSAFAELSAPGRTEVLGPWDRSGYLEEWRRLAEVARGARPAQPIEALADDLLFALAVADGAAEFLRPVPAAVVAV